MQMKSKWWKLACAFLALSGIALAQSGHKTQTLFINGHSGEAIVYTIDGKSYVDIESLVRIGNGSMSFKGDQIILSFPSGEHGSSGQDTSSSNSSAMSADFMRTSVQTLGILKDWTSTLAYAVQRGVPGDGSRLVVFHNRAAEAMRLSQVAASSDADQNALQLLRNHFTTVSGWSDKLVSERKSMDTGKYSISPDALKNDETYKKINACTQFLSTMLPSGTYHDDYSCR
jgi:hypothetical protein